MFNIKIYFMIFLMFHVKHLSFLLLFSTIKAYLNLFTIFTIKLILFIKHFFIAKIICLTLKINIFSKRNSIR